MILIDAERHLLQACGKKRNQAGARLVRVKDLGAGLSQFPAKRVKPAKARQRVDRQVEIHVPLGDGDLPDRGRVFRFILEPEFRVEPMLIEMDHHRHDEIPRADGKMDRMDDLGHGNRLGVGLSVEPN